MADPRGTGRRDETEEAESESRLVQLGQALPGKTVTASLPIHQLARQRDPLSLRDTEAPPWGLGLLSQPRAAAHIAGLPAAFLSGAQPGTPGFGIQGLGAAIGPTR